MHREDAPLHVPVQAALHHNNRSLSPELTFNIFAGFQRRRRKMGGSVPVVAPRFLGKSGEKRTRAWTSKAELQVAAAQLRGMPTDQRAAGGLAIFFFPFYNRGVAKK